MNLVTGVQFFKRSFILLLKRYIGAQAYDVERYC